MRRALKSILNVIGSQCRAANAGLMCSLPLGSVNRLQNLLHSSIIHTNDPTDFHNSYLEQDYFGFQISLIHFNLNYGLSSFCCGLLSQGRDNNP